jgi:magnesium and cobalt transporter
VIEGSRDNVIGILLAKDLLRYYSDRTLNIRDMLRSVVYIPESKRLNVLLKDFRNNRNHMAIVVDEYGSTAGLITIEDVMEQIVGDIEDEYDFDDSEDNIITDGDGHWRVKAITPLKDIDDAMESHFSNENTSTLGELLLSIFGELPKRGETIDYHGYTFRILRADSQQIHSVLITQIEPDLFLDE